MISLNTRGTKSKIEKIINEVKDYDIIFLQEQICDQNVLQKYANSLHRNVRITTDINNNRSLVTMIKRELEKYVIKEEILIEGRVLNINMKINNTQYNFCNIYAPANNRRGEKTIFYRALKERLKELKNILIIGDFNAILSSKDTSAIFMRENYMKEVENLILDKNLVDIHNIMNRSKIRYTFTSSNKTRTRIDKALISKNIQNILVNYDIRINTFSDHEGIEVSLNIKQREIWGKSPWKINNDILCDSLYKNTIFEIIENSLRVKEEALGQLDVHEWWDRLKLKIKKASITYSINKAKSFKEKQNEALKKIKEAQSNIDNGINLEQNHLLLNTLKQEKSREENRKIEGAKIRARIQDIEEGEKSTRYFFKKEKQNGKKKEIKTLVSETSNEILTNPEKIIKEIELFYGTLYASDHVDDMKINDYLNFEMHVLEDNQLDCLNRFISEDEIEKAILNMKNNKSPGDDGLSSEFYKTFKEELKPILCEVMNNCIIKRELPESQRNALITLLYKKEDHRLLKNWRPVSLLNVDYKILSKVATERIRPFMETVVPENQKCGVKGRLIDDLILTLDTITEYFDDNKFEPGAIICIDQEKAFDRINHKYLEAVLRKIGIQGNFLNLILAMYNKITSQVLINGKTSSKINIDRSVRQGCPLSMSLFVLCSIPLIMKIDANPDIKGFMTKNGNEIKILCYADDSTLLIRDPKSVYEIMKMFKNHGIVTEAKINEKKTEVLHLGIWKDKPPDLGKYNENIKNEIKILGHIFTKEKQLMSDRNWEIKLDKIKKILQEINQRHVSIFGKILLSNSLIMSQIWHLGLILDPKKKYINQIYRLLNKWINGEYNEYIIDILKLPICQGGAGLMDIEHRLQTIKIRAIAKIIQTKKSSSTDLLEYWSGTDVQKVFGIDRKKPKCEVPNKKYQNLLKMFVKHAEKLKLAESTCKSIQEILYPQNVNKVDYEGIYRTKNMKFKSLNFQIATGILKTPVKLNLPLKGCIFCKTTNETTHHLFLDCKKVKLLQEEVRRILIENFGKKANMFQENHIIKMENVNNDLEYDIITIYKKAIWTSATKNRYENICITEEQMIRYFYCILDFYMQYIHKIN